MIVLCCILQEFAPSDEELLAYRKDEEWDPEKAKQILKQRVITYLTHFEKVGQYWIHPVLGSVVLLFCNSFSLNIFKKKC